MVELSNTDLALLIFLVGQFLANLRMAGVSEELESRRDAEDLYERLSEALKK